MNFFKTGIGSAFRMYIIYVAFYIILNLYFSSEVAKVNSSSIEILNYNVNYYLALEPNF